MSINRWKNEWALKEDWKINVWDKDGNLIVKDGEKVI